MSATTPSATVLATRAADPIGSCIVDYFFIAGCPRDDVARAAQELLLLAAERGGGEVGSGSGSSRVSLADAANCDALIDLQAIVLDRYPQQERPFSEDNLEEVSELPLAAPIFCFPQGFNAFLDGAGAPDPEVERQHAEMGRPNGRFFTYVLTGSDGTRSYGACLQFLERYTHSFGGAEVTLVVPKVLCILSQYGYFSIFQKYLEWLHRTYHCDQPADTAVPAAVAAARQPVVPLEAEIYRFVLGCSLPQRGYGISYPLGRQGHGRSLRYCCSVGPPAGFPDVDDSCFQTLLDCLSAENLVFVVCSVLLEQRVLLHSEDLDVLNKCGEALIALLFPLCWQHVYVPLLPAQLLEYLSAPVPFIMGVHTSALASQEGIESLPSSVVVHLDYNKVAPPMEVLLPGESGPMLKCTALPELPYELRMKVISKIMAEVPGWKTTRLERADSGTNNNSGRGAQEHDGSSGDGVAARSKPILSSSVSPTSAKKATEKSALSILALQAVKQNVSVEVTFGPGPVGLALQSTKVRCRGHLFFFTAASQHR